MNIIIFSIIGAVFGIIVTTIIFIKFPIPDKTPVIGNLLMRKDEEDGEVYLFLEIKNYSVDDILAMDMVKLRVQKPDTQKIHTL